jgi:hypothetical protein
MTPIAALRLRNMIAIDATVLRAIQDLADAIPTSMWRWHAQSHCTARLPEKSGELFAVTQRKA